LSRSLRTPTRSRARKGLRPNGFVAGLLAPLLAFAGIGTGVLLAASSASADDGTTPTTSVTSVGSGGKDFILAGENASFDISVTNGSGADKYNLSLAALVPAGVDFVSATLIGSPQRYTAGMALPNATRTGGPTPATDCVAPLVPFGPSSPLCAVPAGYEFWVWQNVADLPDTATVSSTVTVMPSAATFPVGTDALRIDVQAYTSNDPTLLAAFDGSTSVASNANHTSKPGTSSATTDVRALRVTKSEPSPEQELLRGVHDNTTTYTIVVDNTGEDDTGSVVVTDYLPAGLEYLGAGVEDNTVLNPSPYLFPSGGGGTLEYPGASSLTGTPPPAPNTGDTPGPGWNGLGETVETVSLDASQATALGLPGPGVYTKVTWTIGTLSGGTAQDFGAKTAGTPGSYTIRYRAAVPLFENTMDWPGATPGINGEQGSNLGNNTGASTRHGIGDPDYNYAQQYTNTVGVVGSYQGPVTNPGDEVSSDDDAVTIEAVDLRVIKSVNPDSFFTGALATYRLDLATSEYTSASGITLTDAIANGLCPAFPDQVPQPTLLVDGVAKTLSEWNTAVGAECAYPNPAGTVTPNVTVTSIAFTSADGSFDVEFAAASMPAQSTAVIQYTAMQRSAYIPDTPSAPRNGATSSGDTMVNHVEVTGTTTAIPALDTVESASGAPAYGDETVADDSTAEIISHFSGLTKKVLERDKDPDQSKPNSSDNGNWPADDYGDWVDHASQSFALGDSVWYRVRVDFAPDIETRQPRLTDFLPQGVQYVGVSYSWDLPGVGSATDTATPDPAYIGAPTVGGGGPTGGGVLTWLLGDVNHGDSSDRFIPMGSWIEFTIQGRVVGQSASSSLVDKPENQAKYQQQNVEGDVFFLRDDASMDLDYGASLVAKGIRDVNGNSTLPAQSQVGPDGTVFGSNRDGITVRQTDVVTYRLDLTAPETDLKDFVVWDALPVGIRAADVSGVTAATVEKVGVGPWSQSPLTSPGDFAFEVVNPGDPGYPAGVAAAYSTRSLVKWTVSKVIPGSDRDTDPALDTIRGLTLGYAVTIPDGTNPLGGPEAEITQDYVNNASIVNYAVVNNGDGMNGDGTSTLVPKPEAAGQVSGVPPLTGQFEVPSDGTYDPSNVTVRDASFAKTLVSTEIAPSGTTVTDSNNPANAIAQGEYATFQYAVTIPAHTSVSNLQLSDGGALAYPSPGWGSSVTYEYLAGSAQFFGPSNTGSVPDTCGAGELTGFTCAETSGATHGVLAYSGVYQNDTATDQVFRVRVTVWVKDTDESHPSYTPNLANNTDLRNTATFRFDDPDGPGTISRTANAQVQYREPAPTLTKAVTNPPSGIVGANGDVTFRLTAGNQSGRVALYDAVVYDCVPQGFTVPSPAFVASSGSASVVPGGCTVTGTGAGQRVVPGGGVNTLIEWNIARINGGASATLDFTAKVDSTAGGGASYVNHAHLVGYTLPSTLPDAATRRGDRATGAEAPVTLSQASLAKSVTTPNGLGSAPVGETVHYTLVVSLPANANFYDVTLTDTLPAGVAYVPGSSAVTIDWQGAPDEPTVGTVVGGDLHEPTITGNVLDWAIAPDDIALHTAARTITVEFDATITNTVPDSATSVTNNAQFAWNTVNGTPATRLHDDKAAAVTILNPALQIVKKVDTVDAITRNPDAGFAYTLAVSQTGAGNTPAYNVRVQDVVPAGVVVTTGTISPTPTSADAGVFTGAGGTIVWDLPGPLYQSAGAGTPKSIPLGYSATFVDSTGLTAAALVNTANVTHFESFGTGSIRDTASVTPLFPDVVPTKTVTNPVSGQTYGLAYQGDAFNWTLTVRNQGLGIAEDVSVTDVLPKNWAYQPGTAMIRIGAAPAVALADPTVTPPTLAEDDQQTLLWTEAAIRAAGAAPLAASGSFVITFDAVPSVWALNDPGTGIIGNGVKVSPHTNTLRVTATDTQDNDHNAGGDYVGPDSTATAYIGEADLLLDKSGVGGVTNSAAFGGIPLGSWIAGQGVTTGYAQPQWQITVTNQGPDAGFGPFAVVDTMAALPAGVSLGNWSARYYSGPGDTTGTALAISPTGSGAGTYTVGTTTTSLKADGSDRIVLVANVTIAAGAVASAAPAALSLTNTASVTGRTYEDPANLPDNTDSDTKQVEELADLAIDKVVTSPVPPTAPVVGSTITWQLTVTNLGPSVSRGAVTPITVTDTVPAGMTGVTATSNGDWAATLSDDSPIPGGGVGAGTTIKWTYIGATDMPLGATAAVSLTGTILTSHTGTLTNSATVTRGDTPDPVTPNNTDDVTVTPNDSTTLTIVKTRVVPDGLGGWRQADPLDPADAFVAGDPVHYRITVTNNGPADARTVKVVDEVPAGLTYDTHESIVGTWGYATGGTTSVYPGGAPLGRTFSTFTLAGTQVAGAPNATSFVVTYDTSPTITGAVVNWAEVTAGNWDPTDPGGTFDRDDDSTGSSRIVDLGIDKSHAGAGPFTPGTPVSYTLVVTNYGPSATNGVIEIEDSLPAGMSYVANSAVVTVPTGTTAPLDANPALSGTGNRVLTWQLLDTTDTFDFNETITITFQALIDPKLRQSVVLTNAAEVDGPDAEPDPDPHSNRDEDTITTGATDADMTITKTVAAGPYLAGTNVTYTLTVENVGPSAVPASVTDTLPTGLTLVSMSGTNWDCSGIVVGAGSGTCAYLDGTDANPVTQVLHPVGTTTITVVAAIAPTVATGTSLLNEAELQWTDGGGTHTDDDDVPITVTTDADLGIVKSVITGAGGTVIAEPAPEIAGTTAWYRLQVTNYGPSDAVGPITVVDELPLGVTVPSTLTTVGSWTVVPGAVTPGNRQLVTFTLPGGQTANTATDTTRGVAPVIEFEVDLDPSIADASTLTNDSTVSSPTPDSNPANDDDSADILADRSADLMVVKSHPVDANGQVVIDQPLDFTIQVTNNGPSIATGITITDDVPVGLEVTSTTGPVAGTGWTIDSITLVDPLDPLGGTTVTASYAPDLGIDVLTNAADPLVISTIVRESARGTSPNHVEVTGNETDPDPSNNEFDDPLDVLPRVKLITTKEAVGTFKVGHTGTYRITVENQGPHDDPGPMVVEDVLPTGLSFASSPDAGVAVSGQTVTWTVSPGLVVGDSVVLTLVVNVLQGAYPSVTNVVDVTTPSELTPDSVTTDSVTVPVEEADPLAWTGSRDQIVLLAAGLVLLLFGLALFAAVARARRMRTE